MSPRKPLPPLFCKVGDVVEFIEGVVTKIWGDDGSTTVGGEVAVGDRYRAVGLVGYGWDLQRISGKGPLEVRVINSQMKECVRIVND